MELIQHILKSQTIQIITIISALVGIVVPIYTLLKKKETWNMAFFMNSHILNKEKYLSSAELKLFYRGSTYDELCITRIFIWNDGNRDIIQDGHLSINRPIEITCQPNVEIIDCRILVSDDDKMDLYSTNQNKIILIFETLKPKEGLVIQVTHTGNSSKDIDVVGIIKGVNGKVKVFRSNSFSFVTGLILIIISTFIIYASYVTENQKDDYITNEGSRLFGICAIFIGVLNLFLDRTRRLNKRFKKFMLTEKMD